MQDEFTKIGNRQRKCEEQYKGVVEGFPESLNFKNCLCEKCTNRYGKYRFAVCTFRDCLLTAPEIRIERAKEEERGGGAR